VPADLSQWVVERRAGSGTSCVSLHLCFFCCASADLASSQGRTMAVFILCELGYSGCGYNVSCKECVRQHPTARVCVARPGLRVSAGPVTRLRFWGRPGMRATTVTARLRGRGLPIGFGPPRRSWDVPSTAPARGTRECTLSLTCPTRIRATPGSGPPKLTHSSNLISTKIRGNNTTTCNHHELTLPPNLDQS
jgi:hypothetical protein